MPEPILIAGFSTPAIRAIEYLFSEGYKPADIGLLTHDQERNSPLMAFAKVHGIEITFESVKRPSVKIGLD